MRFTREKRRKHWESRSDFMNDESVFAPIIVITTGVYQLTPLEGSVSSDYNKHSNHKAQSTTEHWIQQAGGWKLHKTFIFSQVPDK